MDNEYKNIQHLEQTFIQGQMGQFPETLIVEGIRYNFLQHRDDVTWRDIVTNKTNKAMTIYSIAKDQENAQQFQQIQRDVDNRAVPDEILAFGWSATNQMRVAPIGNAFTTRSRVSTNRMFEQTDISYSEPVTIAGLNDDQPFQSKIDTGADLCSLHAENIQVNNGTVSFECGGKRYQMQMHRSQAIKQADSEPEQRPVVLLNFVIAGHTIPNVECNLNDRSGMSSPLLVGRNLLSKHDFNIQTNENGELTDEEWEQMDALFEDRVIEESHERPELTTSEIVKLLMKADISVPELVQEAYRMGIENGNDITY